MKTWISVYEKLPDKDLAGNHTNIFQEDIKWKCINIGHKNSYNNVFINDSDDTTFIDVTHWMLLPEIPIE